MADQLFDCQMLVLLSSFCVVFGDVYIAMTWKFGKRNDVNLSLGSG
jgi:hypothetical protein